MNKTLVRLRKWVNDSPYEVAGVLKLDGGELVCTGMIRDERHSVDIESIRHHPRTFHTHPRRTGCRMKVPSPEDILFVYRNLQPSQEHWVVTEAGLFRLRSRRHSKDEFDSLLVARMLDIMDTSCPKSSNTQSIRKWEKTINANGLADIKFIPWTRLTAGSQRVSGSRGPRRYSQAPQSR
jgi:hypothetical protein